MDELVNAIVSEIAIRKDYLRKDENLPVLETIYFGGGTPSLLNEVQLHRIFDAIRKYYIISPSAEFTLEANPDDLTSEKLGMLRKSPVNRLSIGVQSFFAEDLLLMNRAHTAEEASASVMRAYESGFSNITIDLIYGLPGLTPARWQENLDKAFSLPVNHLSCYCLTVEKKTALDKMVREGKVEVPDEDLAAQHFLQLMDEAEKRGFEHYEISNFAKPDFRSRHNSAYWSGEHYIGIGPSAHSYNGFSRQWNVASNAAYADAISKGEIPATTETLTISNRYNEYIMTSLRTMEGIDAEVVSRDFGEDFLSDLLTHAEPWIDNGSLIIQNRHLKLTREGKLLADRIAAAFFV